MKNNIISSFDIFSSKSKDLCLIDPLMLCLIIIILCLFLYIVGYKLPATDTI